MGNMNQTVGLHEEQEQRKSLFAIQHRLFVETRLVRNGPHFNPKIIHREHKPLGIRDQGLFRGFKFLFLLQIYLPMLRVQTLIRAFNSAPSVRACR
jgi:hypothetical protein